MAVTVTRGGYLKRTAVDTYRRQIARRQGPHRHGHARGGFRGAPDRRLHPRYLLIFTNKGRVYWLKIYEIPDATTTGKGKHISNLINLQPDETVKAFLAVKDFVAGSVHRDGDQARRHQEVRADRVRQSAWRAASSPSRSTTATN